MQVFTRSDQNSGFIEQVLKQTMDQMLENEQKGDYSEAQKCRVKLEKGKKDLEDKQLNEKHERHRREQRDMERAHQEEMKHMNSFWEGKIKEFLHQGDRLLSELDIKHAEQCAKIKEKLNSQLSLKVKESSELLNLRKMEEQMAKQKNYAEAHLVQEKIKKLYSQESNSWNVHRQQKINAAINNWKTKHKSEKENLKKRIKTGEEEQRKDWHMEEIRLNQKYDNLHKELKALQEREVISFKGEFRSKGGSVIQSPMRKTFKIKA